MPVNTISAAESDKHQRNLPILITGWMFMGDVTFRLSIKFILKCFVRVEDMNTPWSVFCTGDLIYLFMKLL